MSQKTAEPQSDQRQLTKMILVVEDDEGVGVFLVQAISQETPYQALLVTDGFQALKAVKKMKPDLFILDYQLPNMNGIDLFDRLHAMEELSGLPAIIMSARLPKQEIEKRQLIGMHKPLELDELLHTIEDLLS
ncbi:MAG: response regulator [Ktedonobacteraceae bacterium]|nr:response regulator [Chloroflexota bacterium]